MKLRSKKGFLMGIGLASAFLFQCYSRPLWGRDIILITYGNFPREALRIQAILTEKLHLPAILIQKRWDRQPCRPRPETVAHICIGEKDGQMQILHTERSVLEESFTIFFSGY